MDAIIRQFDEDIKRFDLDKKSIESLFIGGGTPSTIQPKQYKAFFEKISPYLKDDIEITSEANPNSASKEWLEGMRDLGVNRISFGVQSFNEKKLKFLNRSHSKEMAINAINDAHKVGFKHISLDLIYATSMDTKKLLQDDLLSAFSLPIDHISAYALTLEEGTKFFNMPNVKSDDEEFAHWISSMIKQQGFNQYEVSNFGKYESYHNKGYWRYKPYIGIGAGAVGFLKHSRFYPHKDIQMYIDDPYYAECEKLSKEDIIKEKILLGLRSNIGFESKLLDKSQLEKAQFLLSEKKLREENGRFFSNELFLADEITLYIIL